MNKQFPKTKKFLVTNKCLDEKEKYEGRIEKERVNSKIKERKR